MLSPGDGLAAVLWDLDGTLVDSERLYFTAVAGICAASGIRLQWEHYSAWIGQSDRFVWRCLKNKHALQLSAEVFLEQLAVGYRNVLESLKCRPGVPETVRELRRRGVRQAVVSNAPRTLVHASLEAAGIRNEFETIISEDDVEHPKPHPSPYRRAMALVSCRPAQCLAIEDSAVGVRSALDAGITPVNWPQPGVSSAVVGVKIIHTIADILQYKFSPPARD